MELDDFNLMVKGFFDKRKRDEVNFANLGFIIDSFAAGFGGKKITYKKWIAQWFGETAPKLSQEETKQRSKEMMDRVRLTNKILEEKEKIVGEKKKSTDKFNRKRKR